MDEKSNNTQDKWEITLSDLFLLSKRARKTVFISAILMGLLGAFFALTRPIQYEATGSFREKNIKSSNLNNSLMAFMGETSTSTFDHEAIGTLKSRKMLAPVVQKLNLQASISKKGTADGYLNLIGDNLKAHFGRFSNPYYPSLLDKECPLKIEDVHYAKEIPHFYEVIFQSHSHYQLVDIITGEVSQGKLNVPQYTPIGNFTLKCETPSFQKSESYIVTLWPMELQTTRIANRLNIDADKFDKSLLKISYRDSNRHVSSEVVNQLMDIYKGYLTDTHDREAALQLDYLKKRQEETEQKFSQLMQNHANNLSKDLSSTGFADSEKEIEFLAEREHGFKERLISNELEIKRLQNLESGKCVYYDCYQGDLGDSNNINTIFTQIRNLKQHRDDLELALAKSDYLNAEELQHTFERQLKELEQIQVYIDEIETLKQDLSIAKNPNTHSSIFKNPHLLIKSWYEKVSSENDHPFILSPETAHFLIYLDNLERLFHVHEKIIKERVIHQQNDVVEFQGINLTSADELYTTYSKKLNELEAKAKENTFLISQMQDPHFEISSLSTALNDSVSRDIISRASELLQNLKDEANRSSKEQERLKEDLSRQKEFLQMHLQQTNQLLQLNQQIIHEKIFILQNVTLDLIHQRISLLEKSLHDYIVSRLENLHQERVVIKQHMEELHQEMATLPQRWVSEQLIKKNLEINEVIVQEIVKMVESRNISHKLELIQSAPIDKALPPIHPLSSHLFLFSVIGALCGAIISFGTVLGKSASRGLTVSSSTLRSMNQHVAGSLSEGCDINGVLRDDDLETLRRLQNYMESSLDNGKGRELLLIEGEGIDYSTQLALLLSKKGQKVVIIHLSFNRSASFDKEGLLSYLEGKITFPRIDLTPYGGIIEAGGCSRFSIELLKTSAFKTFLEKCRTQYNWVIAVTNASPTSAEAEGMISMFPLVGVSVGSETVANLEPYFNHAAKSGNRVSFVMLPSGII